MALKTYSQMITKIKYDLDLISEPFISDDELLGYFNDGLESAETAIHTLGLNAIYFRTNDFLYLNAGQAIYQPPADIYANKILKMWYQNPTTQSLVSSARTIDTNVVVVTAATGLFQGMAVFGTGIPRTTKIASISGLNVTLSKNATASGTSVLTFVSPVPVQGAIRYEVRAIRNAEDAFCNYPGDNYSYLIINYPQEAGGNQIQIFPTPTESGALMPLYYIREIRKLTTSLTDPYNVCEVAECTNYIYQFVRWRVAKKRRIAEVVAVELADLKTEYELLQATFKEMIPDCNNKVQQDLSSYFDQELDLYY